MPEYAPLYSRKERIRIAVMLMLIVVPLLLVSQFWLIPGISDFTAVANCVFVGGVNGVQLLLYGVFVWMPLSFATLLLLLLGRRCIRIIRAGQDPLPGEKVLRPTKYRYGRAALLMPVLVLIIEIGMIGFATWGGFQAEKLGRTVLPCREMQPIRLEPLL